MEPYSSLNPLPPASTRINREELINGARQRWVRKLIDTGRKNNLLFFRDLTVGTLTTTDCDNEAITNLLAGKQVPLKRLVADQSMDNAAAKLKTITRKAQENLEEKGLQTLFLACGMATWTPDDHIKSPPRAAVLLVPIEIVGDKRNPETVKVNMREEPELNIALLHYLREELKIKFSNDEVLGAEGDKVDPQRVIENLRRITLAINGFQITSESAIANFSFEKLVMIHDMIAGLPLMESNDVIMALAGDFGARERMGKKNLNFEPAALDDISAKHEYMILDADSSQQAIVHSVVRGASGVIQGPPGCGKSQTIANLITSLVANGKRVLFVAEKRAALEAVYKRIDEVGLGHIALDLHGKKVKQKEVMRSVGDTLRFIETNWIVDDTNLLRQFDDARAHLVTHVKGMHQKLPPANLSPYELLIKCIEIRRKAIARTKFRGAVLKNLTPETYDHLSSLLLEAIPCEPLVLGATDSAWSSARLNDEKDVQYMLDAIEETSRKYLPNALDRMTKFSESMQLRMPKSGAEALELFKLIERTNSFFQNGSPELLQFPSLAEDLRKSQVSFFEKLLARLSNSAFRASEQRIKRLANQCPPGHSLLERAEESLKLVAEWSNWDLSGKGPRPVVYDTDLNDAYVFLETKINLINLSIPKVNLQDFDNLNNTLLSLLRQQRIAHLVPTFVRLYDTFERFQVAKFLEEVRDAGIGSKHWHDYFESSYYASCYDYACTEVPSLVNLNTVSQLQTTRAFQALDAERIRLGAIRVAREYASAAKQSMVMHSEQAQKVRHEAQKRSRHMTLRNLVDQSGEVLTAVCPCWMASPLNVARLLPLRADLFDVVIFDEASQVLTEDAICAILRGRQLVVAGDPNQLPPTKFFASSIEDDSDDDGDFSAGSESLLDELGPFLNHWPLEWHYRSRDERLIAFSNQHIYNNRLTTFPSCGSQTAVSHILVDQPPQDGENESSTREVIKVVDLILAHGKSQLDKPPEERESLGVITFGLEHAGRIQARLDRELSEKPEVAEFLDTSKDNAQFFLKNIERVQGDERDVIILSVGYSKDLSGKLPHRFGPLNQEGGERRLNVAITRAKTRMTVVSSFSYRDMDPTKCKATGADLLRKFLQFAESGGENLGVNGLTSQGMNAFESDIFEALKRRGMSMIPQYGVSGYRLDFAVKHPSRPGDFVLAIECDGASYHSGKTARDRDRLRQQQLESRGWRFHRIWSTEWAIHREQEIERAVKAWEEAIVSSDRDYDRISRLA